MHSDKCCRMVLMHLLIMYLLLDSNFINKNAIKFTREFIIETNEG